MRDLKSFFLSGVPQKNRFLKGDKPDQNIFTKLFDSIGFIAEKSDRAKITEQGFVKIVGPVNAKNFTNPDTDFTYAVQPNQLPETKAKDQDTQLSDVPLSTVEVIRDLTANADRATFYVRLKQSFLQWMISRMLPQGGTKAQVLKKSSTKSYDTIWDDADKMVTWNILYDGADYAYYKKGQLTNNTTGNTYLYPGQGVLNLDVAYNSYLLQGNPDPIPYDYNSYGEYCFISVPGANPGFRLKLKYGGSPNNPEPLAFFEHGVFAGNIDLGNFAESIGGRRGLFVNINDTLTFVYDSNKKWVLWDCSSIQGKVLTDELRKGDTVRVGAITTYDNLAEGTTVAPIHSSMHAISNLVHVTGKFSISTTASAGTFKVNSYWTPIHHTTEYLIGQGTLYTNPGGLGTIGVPVGGIEVWAQAGTDKMVIKYSVNTPGTYLGIFSASFRA